MALFIRHEPEWVETSDRVYDLTGQELVRAYRYSGPVPQGRSDCTGQPSDWRPDAYGYTDFDDYKLAVFGA